MLLPARDTFLVVVALRILSEERGVNRVEASSYRITTSSETVATYGPFPGAPTYTDPSMGPMGMAFVPFGAITSFATLGDTLIVGTGDSGGPRSSSSPIRRPDDCWERRSCVYLNPKRA